ncbi:MAG: hypothetical protein ACI9LV_000173 [Candidatus Nanohaloarchaea archaeon]|jgi:hypothetical protein
MKEEYRCSECGKIFGSGDTLLKHWDLEHGGIEQKNELAEFGIPETSLDRESAAGFAIGFLLTAALIGGFVYMQSQEPAVDITVVTCENCSYGEFRNTTGELFKVNYHEVDYRSEEGQRLVEKYDLYYVPGFIFDREVENRENFTRIESVVVEFDDAYVLPDKGVTAAQRVSEGRSLDR